MDTFVVGEVEVVESTDDEILVNAIDDEADDILDGLSARVPRSQIDEDESDVLEEGDEGLLIVNRSWAAEQGWCEEDGSEDDEDDE